MAKKSSRLDVDKLLANENIITGEISNEIKTSMLSYSMLVILSRAIPDVLDGLKPAQRRILYSCLEQKHDWNKPYVKNAKISGEVMGNYHPHASCYGTIVNMSQDWEFRYPLIDFHGCNGSVSGDDAAADRYTEGRLQKISYTLLEDVMDECSVEFRPNYSETTKEPVVLPALLPNFLINGASGIAVGMTTNCPSHNLTEVCDALIYALQNKEYELKDLMRFIKGPDAPLGGCISSENLKELYETGKAKVVYRANYEIEINHENENPQIVFTDITPNMNINKTLEKIYNMISSKQLVKALDVRDESEDKQLRIVIECSKTANLNFIINTLYKETDLQKSISYVMCGIVNKTPKLITLMDYVSIYLENRRKVLKKRMKFLVDEESKKLEINRGIAKVMDKVKVMSKEIIDCEDDQEALDLLMNKYGLTELQANYILDKKIRSLVKKNINAIHVLIHNLENSIAEHKAILEDDDTRNKFIVKELTELKEQFGDARRTKIVNKFKEMSEEETDKFIDAVVVNTTSGLKLYDKKDFDDSKLRDKSAIFKSYFDCKINDDIFIIFKNGEISSIKARDIDGAKIKDVMSVYPANIDKTIFTILKNGLAKKTHISKLKSGKKLIKDIDCDIAANKLISDTEDEIINLATNQGCVSRFSANSFTSTGLGTRGTPTSKLEDGDFIVDCEVSSLSNNDTDKILMLYENSDNTFGYKVMKAKDILIKGRISRAIKHIFDKNFSKMLKINIGDKATFYDEKNNLLEIKKYVFKHRIEKGDIVKNHPNTFNIERI